MKTAVVCKHKLVKFIMHLCLLYPHLFPYLAAARWTEALSNAYHVRSIMLE